MARVALGLGIRKLASRAKVAPGTVSRFEAGEELKERTVDALQSALQSAGVVFFDGAMRAAAVPAVVSLGRGPWAARSRWTNPRLSSIRSFSKAMAG